MPFGILDTRYIDLPANIDAQYLEGLRTRAGVDFATILREIDRRIAALNTGLDPLVAALITPTTEQYADATGPIAFEVTERGEYTIARPQLAEGGAHMLPLSGFDVSLGFTEDGLEKMSLNRLMANVDSMLLGIRKLYRAQVLRRLTSDAEVRVARNTIVTSPGFAGSGTGDNVFPRTTYPDGMPLGNGYSHYFRVAAASLGAGIKTGRDRMKKWHKEGTYHLIAPQSQIDAIALINPGNPADGFVAAGSPLVRAGANNSEATVDPMQYVGVLFGDILVHHAITDYSDPNIALFNSYGPTAPGNALAWRFDEITGRNAVLRSRENYPLSNATLKQDFGIGVNDRTAAILIRVGASGGYVAPVIN